MGPVTQRPQLSLLRIQNLISCPCCRYLSCLLRCAVRRPNELLPSTRPVRTARPTRRSCRSRTRVGEEGMVGPQSPLTTSLNAQGYTSAQAHALMPIYINTQKLGQTGILLSALFAFATPHPFSPVLASSRTALSSAPHHASPPPPPESTVDPGPGFIV